MSFTFRPAKREAIPLLISLAGGTGSGKTLSALKIARGLADGQPFAGIDTENGRMQHYADHFPELQHSPFGPPFRPERYIEAIRDADAEGFPVILIDSGSHAYAGDGGLLDWHDEELTRIAGDDWKKREAMTFAAWVKPKQAQKRFVSQLLQMRAHVIVCLRAESKIDIVKDPQTGKTKVIPKKSLVGADGWVPVCEKNFAYEMTLSLLLTADAPGVPKPIKLNADHRSFVPLDAPLTEETGRALARWAAGSAGGPQAEAAKEATRPPVSQAGSDEPASPADQMPSGAPPSSPASEGTPKRDTTKMKKKLDVLVGKLRPEHLSTLQLWQSMGREPVLSEDGLLHWKDLRESLTWDECMALIDRLETYAKVKAA